MGMIKNENLKFRKISRKTIVLVVLLIISTIICLYHFGKHIDPPLSIRAELSNSSINAEEKFFEQGNGGAVIDTGLTRLQFLDADEKVVGIENPNIMNQSVCYFQDCVISGAKRYVLEYTTYANTKNIKTEQVVRFNNLGFAEETILQNTYSNEDNIKNPRLISLCKKSETEILGVQIDNNNKNVSIININSCETLKEITINLSSEIIIDAKYNDNTNTLGILTNSGQIISYNNNKIIIDTNPSAKKINFDANNNIVPVLANADSTSCEYNFSAFNIFKNLLFWMALCYLVIFILCFAIKTLKKKPSKKVLLYCGILLGIIILLVTVLFYSFQYFNLETDQQIQIIKTSAKNTSLNSKNFIKNEITNSNNLSASQSLQNYLETIKSNGTENNINIDYGVVIENEDENTINLLYSTNHKIRPATYKSDQLISKNISQNNERNGEYVFNDYSSLGIGTSEKLFDLEHNRVIYLYVSADLLSLNSDFLYNVINAFILLLSIIISISLLLFEIYGFISSKKTYRKYRLEKFKNPEIGFTRTFVFLQQFLISFDSALMVLIAIDLLNTSNMANNPALISIPTVCCSTGMTISTPIFNIVSKKVNIRPIIVVCSIFLIGFYVLDFVAIIKTDFILYCVFIALGGVFCGILNSVQWYLPLLSPNDEIRFNINKTTVQASVASIIIAVAVSGIIADCFGSQWVYIFACLSLIGIIAMGISVFPKNQKYFKPQEKNKLTHAKKSFKFFLSPIFICYVLFLYITVNISGSYKGLLFPIFSSSAGFSKSMISNFIVITNFVAMLMSSTSKNITKNNNYFSLSIISVFMVGLTFLSFNINDSVIWSVAVIAVIAIFSKIASLNNAMIWPILCRDKNFPEQTCNKFLKYANDIIFTLKNLILSSLLVFGSTAVCNILGLYSCIGVLIFALICLAQKKFKTQQ